MLISALRIFGMKNPEISDKVGHGIYDRHDVLFALSRDFLDQLDDTFY